MESTTLETSKSGNPIEALAPETEMLSAEEKIEELNTLLQQKISNLEKLEQDLLEVQVCSNLLISFTDFFLTIVAD